MARQDVTESIRELLSGNHLSKPLSACRRCDGFLASPIPAMQSILGRRSLCDNDAVEIAGGMRDQWRLVTVVGA